MAATNGSGSRSSRTQERALPDGDGDRPSVRFVLLKRYCAITGDTSQAVHNRRHKGEWIDGKHCVLVGGRRLWIDLYEVEQWIASGGLST